MEEPYVYLVYRDEIKHTVGVVAKVGKGMKRRYRSYTTPYGTGYKVYLVVPDSGDYSACEKDLLTWCRDKGYLQNRSEIVTAIPNDEDTWKDMKEKHLAIIADIKLKMETYGRTYNAGINGKLWYLDPCMGSPAPLSIAIEEDIDLRLHLASNRHNVEEPTSIDRDVDLWLYLASSRNPPIVQPHKPNRLLTFFKSLGRFLPFRS